ncbi:MAK10-like protein [Tanacetum coccineum]
MGDENPIRTLGDYSKPSHEGYRNTIKLPARNNVVPLRSDTIRLVQNGCSFHGLWFEDPNQHLKDFLKLVDLFNLDGENRENEPLTNRPVNDPRDFAKPVKAIALPQDVPSTFYRRLIKLKNQVQRLMEAHLAPTQPTQVNKITTPCEICSGPHDTQYCMEDPEQAFVEYASSCADEAGEEDGEVMFIEIIRDDDEPQNESLNKGEGTATEGPTVEYFDMFPTRDELTYHKLSLASHSYIYPLGIAEDVLVEVVEHIFPIDFVILDIKENKKRPFSLGTPFLTTAKATIKFDIGTITLRSGKSKISFHRISDSSCITDRGVKNDIGPMAPIMTVNRDPDRDVPVAESFHEQTDVELTKKEVKQMEVDDQAI